MSARRLWIASRIGRVLDWPPRPGPEDGRRWWDDLGAYDPSRFMPDADKDRHRFCYLPLSAGQRVCIGMSFALMEGTLIAAMMTQRFRFDVVPGHPVQPEATLTLRPRNGVRMIAHQRTTAR